MRVDGKGALFCSVLSFHFWHVDIVTYLLVILKSNLLLAVLHFK